jgi:hypothetical protein
MEHSDIVIMIKSMGLPFAYDHFAEGESPDPPFIVFLLPASDNQGADGGVYEKVKNLHIELYTEIKDPEKENEIEAVLDSRGIFYDKSEVWIGEDDLYEVLYMMEV